MGFFRSLETKRKSRNCQESMKPQNSRNSSIQNFPQWKETKNYHRIAHWGCKSSLKPQKSNSTPRWRTTPALPCRNSKKKASLRNTISWKSSLRNQRDSLKTARSSSNQQKSPKMSPLNCSTNLSSRVTTAQKRLKRFRRSNVNNSSRPSTRTTIRSRSKFCSSFSP